MVGVGDGSGRLGPRDGDRHRRVIAQVCIADLDLHGLVVVVHRVVEDFNDGDSLFRTAPNPIIDLRSPGVVRPFRSRAARDGLEVETDKLRIRLRELDFEIEPPVVLVPGRVIDPNRQTRHAGRGWSRRVDRSRRLGPRDVEKLNYVAVGIDPARVAELDLHGLAGVVNNTVSSMSAKPICAVLSPARMTWV